MESRKNTSDILLDVYRIVQHRTGYEKWIYFENPKRKKSWVGRPRRTIHINHKTESLWQKDDAVSLVEPERGVYCELLKHRQTINTKRYQHQLPDLYVSCLKKGQNIERGKIKSFFFMTMLHHQPHQQQVRDTFEVLSWKVLPYSAYSLNLAFRLSLVCIDELRTCSTALWFERRCEKMVLWMVRSKKRRFLLARDHK